MAMGPLSPAGGGNPSGFNVASLPAVGGGQPFGSPSVGSTSTNPIMAPFPGGTNMANPMQAGGGNPVPGGGASAPMPGGMPGNPFGVPKGDGKGSWMKYKDALAKGFHSAGFPSAIGDMIATFLSSGAGFSPEILQNLFAQLNPQIQRGQADIMEHFGSMGQGQGSAAALGFGDFMGQVNLNESNMATQLYEQSIQNFLSLITKGNEVSVAKAGNPSGGAAGIGGLLGGIGSLAGAIGGFPGIGSLLGGVGGAASGGGGGGSSTGDF